MTTGWLVSAAWAASLAWALPVSARAKMEMSDLMVLHGVTRWLMWSQ